MSLRLPHALAAVVAVAAIAAAALLLAGHSSKGEASSCGQTPAPQLVPSGSGASAFTMGIRVNKESDVDAIESSLGDLIQARDVLVVNTEFAGGSPSESEAVVEKLSEAFPCNRIAALNGLGTDPGKPGYAAALAGNSNVDAILLDWEPDTYEDAGRGAWSSELERNLPRISEQLGLLAKRLDGTRTRMGLVPDYLPRWDYGRTARTVALSNFALDSGSLGYQLVQTQPNCGTPSAAGPLLGAAVSDLIRQYRPLFGERLGSSELPPLLVQHLAFEIAFDETPSPHASEAVDRIGPEQAAACTEEVLDAGGAGILYWATPESIKAMLETATGKALRSPSSS